MSADSTLGEADIEIQLNEVGLDLRGVLLAVKARCAKLAWPEPAAVGFSAAALLLVGNVGERMWRKFTPSQEYCDGKPDPLDRWSERVLSTVAERLWSESNRVAAIYPFTGPPYWPFQRWARACEPLFDSPLGLLIHPRFGLWHAYRGALLIEYFAPRAQSADSSECGHPCLSCQTKPCLSACPVAAFSPLISTEKVTSEYDVESCIGHVKGGGSECQGGGCLARLACPQARDWTYTTAQHRFHLQAFVRAMTSHRGN